MCCTRDSSEEEPNKEEIFSAVGDSENNVMQIESLCMNCSENGVTRMLLVDVPYFKRIVVSSFECPHCNHKDEQIQSVEPVADKGMSIELHLRTREDLNRHIVRQDSAEVIIPHLEFSSPAAPNMSMVATVEGLIYRFIERLQVAVDGYKQVGEIDLAIKLAEFVLKLNRLIDDFEPFTLIIDDPAGNSYIENFMAPNVDPDLKIRKYTRTNEQSRQLGLVIEEEEHGPPPNTTEIKNGQPNESEMNNDGPILVDGTNSLDKENTDNIDNDYIDDDKRFFITSSCSNCHAEVTTIIQTVDVPYFKQVIIMSYNCEKCGNRTNEVKPTNSVEDQGTKISLRMEGEYDLSRDMLKSEFCSIKIPELDIELAPGTMGSKFTTVDSFLLELKERMHEWNPFSTGDSASSKSKERITKITETLDKVKI